MQILSHRGYWEIPEEKNSIVAFKKSFGLGFGTETDIRDYKGELVIAHDIASKEDISLDEFFEIYKSYDENLYLALNIKSDGLQKKLKEKLEKFKITNYFVFDMSVPDGLGYLKNCFNTFTRQSEYETNPSFYNKAIGVWLDSFNEDWITNSQITKHLENNKLVCIVSPELHKRPYLKVWEKYKNLAKEKNLFLCTDFPEEAKKFFNL